MVQTVFRIDIKKISETKVDRSRIIVYLMFQKAIRNPAFETIGSLERRNLSQITGHLLNVDSR